MKTFNVTIRTAAGIIQLEAIGRNSVDAAISIQLPNDEPFGVTSMVQK